MNSNNNTTFAERQVKVKRVRLYLEKITRAKVKTGLPFSGLVPYYIIAFFMKFRWLGLAIYTAKLLNRAFSANNAVNLILADLYRQISQFDEESKALMTIVQNNSHDIDLLFRAVDTAAYAGDLTCLKSLRAIVAQENLSLLAFIDGLMGFMNGRENYQLHFQKAVTLFLEPEASGASVTSGQSMSLLMMSAIKSGRYIPEFIRLAYSIREFESINELLRRDNPLRALASLPGVVDRTAVQGLGPSDPIVLISCSECYLKVFADYYIQIFRRKNQHIIHFHVLSEDVEAIRSYMDALQEKYSNVRYSIEAISGESQTYITLARFLICRHLMAHYNRDVLISDLDFHPDFDLQSVCRELRSQQFDFGLCDAGYSVPWAKFSVGFSYFRVANHPSDFFMDLLSRYLASLYSDGGFFSMDQIGATLIYDYMKSRGDTFRMLNLHGIIDYEGLFKVPHKLARGKIKCKFGNGAPQ